MSGKKLKVSIMSPQKQDHMGPIRKSIAGLYKDSEKHAKELADLHVVIDRFLFDKPMVKEIVEVYRDLKVTYEHMESTKKILNAIKERFQYGIVPNTFEREGMGGTTFPELGFRIAITDGIRVSIPDYKREEAKQLFKDTGNPDIVQETINASTLKGWFCEELAEGREPDSDIFVSVPYNNTSLTKIKKKG